MSEAPLLTAVLAWAAIFAAALAGMWIGKRLPAAHRTRASIDIAKTSMAVVGTLTALALGLLISSANSSFNATQDQLLSTSSDIIRMDRVLRLYGPEVKYARQKLRSYAMAMRRDLFPSDGQGATVEDEGTLDFLAWAEYKIALLAPKDDNQRWLLPHMQDVANKLVDEHFALVKQEHYALPSTVVAFLMVWLVVLFVSYGLYSPRHLTAVMMLLLSSATASGAIFLILELQRGTHGFICISPESLLHAIEIIERNPDAS